MTQRLTLNDKYQLFGNGLLVVPDGYAESFTINYTLTQSDNNASNLMFKDMVNVAQTDSFIATLIPRSSFQIAYTEEVLL